MELGATVCLPRNPLCLHCPVQQSCPTRGEHPTAQAQAQHHRRNSLCPHPKKTPRRRPGAPANSVRLAQPSCPACGNSRYSRRTSAPRHPIQTSRYSLSATPSCRPTTASPYSHSLQALLAIKQKLATQSWISLTDLASLPLTGLARKIFLRLGVLESLR